MMWGGLAARLVKPKGVLFAVSGLGTLFGEERNGLLAKAIQKCLKVGMHSKNGVVIFQNHEDETLFVENGITSKCVNYFIKGSGVDLSQYTPNDNKNSNPMKVIFTASMLKEKGVEDLIAAAEILRGNYDEEI